MVGAVVGLEPHRSWLSAPEDADRLLLRTGLVFARKQCAQLDPLSREASSPISLVPVSVHFGGIGAVCPAPPRTKVQYMREQGLLLLGIHNVAAASGIAPVGRHLEIFGKEPGISLVAFLSDAADFQFDALWVLGPISGARTQLSEQIQLIRWEIVGTGGRVGGRRNGDPVFKYRNPAAAL